VKRHALTVDTQQQQEKKKLTNKWLGIRYHEDVEAAQDGGVSDIIASGFRCILI
jgi:hypothetical protein